MSESENIDEIPVYPGSGNVFADLGFPNPEEELLKADLVYQIIRATHERGLSETKAAAILDLSRVEVSRLIQGQYEEISVGRLLQFLTALGIDVEIVLSRSQSARGGARVRIAS